MNAPHTETRDGFTLQWQKCCCGVKCWATRLGAPPDTAPLPVGEFPFHDTFEQTADRYGPAAIKRATELMP